MRRVLAAATIGFALLVGATGGAARGVAADPMDDGACQPIQIPIGRPITLIFIAPAVIFIPPISGIMPQGQQTSGSVYPGDGLGRGSCQ